MAHVESRDTHVLSREARAFEVYAETRAGRRSSTQGETMSDWRDDAQQRVKDKKQGATMRLEVGSSCVRVLPNKKDLLPDGRLGPKGIKHRPYKEFRIHREVGPDKAM